MMRVFQVAGRAGISFEGSGSDRVWLWLRGPRYFRRFMFRTPVNLSRHSWRYAIRQMGFWRAVRARGFAKP